MSFLVLINPFYAFSWLYFYFILYDCYQIQTLTNKVLCGLGIIIILFKCWIQVVMIAMVNHGVNRIGWRLMCLEHVLTLLVLGVSLFLYSPWKLMLYLGMVYVKVIQASLGRMRTTSYLMRKGWDYYVFLILSNFNFVYLYLGALLGMIRLILN